MNIEKKLFPKSNTLKFKEGLITGTIVDAELDEIKCMFHKDNGVVLDTEDVDWVSLSIDNLRELIRMVEEVEKNE